MVLLRLRGLGELEYFYKLEHLAAELYIFTGWQCIAHVQREDLEHPGEFVEEIWDSGIHRKHPDLFVSGFVPRVPGKVFEHDYSKRRNTPEVGYCPIVGKSPETERATLMEIVEVR